MLGAGVPPRAAHSHRTSFNSRNVLYLHCPIPEPHVATEHCDVADVIEMSVSFHSGHRIGGHCPKAQPETSGLIGRRFVPWFQGTRPGSAYTFPAATRRMSPALLSRPHGNRTRTDQTARPRSARLHLGEAEIGPGVLLMALLWFLCSKAHSVSSTSVPCTHMFGLMEP